MDHWSLLSDPQPNLNALSLSMPNDAAFIGLFHEPHINRYAVAPKVELSMFILKSDGGGFDYTNLYRQLGNASIAYVLSRHRVAGVTPDTHHEVVKSVQRSFRRSSENKGEGGELLLYCFLESHLKAPKILSKMELKTASNDYVKGADGLHLYEVAPGTYHLIFGESKMIGDSTEPRSSFRKAIVDALDSIKEVESNGLLDEIQLIDSNLMKETFTGDKLSFLKALLVPSGNNGPTKQTAFGIFIGFEIDIREWPLIEMAASAIEARIHSEVLDMVESRYDFLKKKIVERGLAGYHFYLFALPFVKSAFSDIDSVRTTIIEEI